MIRPTTLIEGEPTLLGIITVIILNIIVLLYYILVQMFEELY